MIPMAISEAKTVLETVKASPNKRMPGFFRLGGWLADHGVVHLVKHQAENHQNRDGYQKAGSGIQAFFII